MLKRIDKYDVPKEVYIICKPCTAAEPYPYRRFEYYIKRTHTARNYTVFKHFGFGIYRYTNTRQYVCSKCSNLIKHTSKGFCRVSRILRVHEMYGKLL